MKPCPTARRHEQMLNMMSTNGMTQKLKDCINQVRKVRLNSNESELLAYRGRSTATASIGAGSLRSYEREEVLRYEKVRRFFSIIQQLL